MSTVSVRRVSSCTDLVRTAIENTPKEYWEKLCRSRARGDEMQAGSYLPFDAKRIDQLVKGLEWEPYTHSAVKAPATAFIADHVFGVMNVIHIDQVSPGAKLVFENMKGGTSKFECVWRTEWKRSEEASPALVDFLVLLVGPDDAGKDIVWTFHPGDPVKPSDLEAEELVDFPAGCDRESAKLLGVEWVKIAPPLGTGPAK